MAFCELHYFSEALGLQQAANVLLPDKPLRVPHHVMFLLHGLSDDHTIWHRRTSIERYLQGVPLIVVMPDGGRGFYCDAEAGFAYATALSVELPALIETTFHTRKPWCVSGLSMGGYGAVRFGLSRPDLFVSAHSMSGAPGFGHSPWPTTEEPDAEFLRIAGKNPQGGPNDLYHLAKELRPNLRPKIRIDCGADDFLLADNRAYHKHLDSIGYSHEYEEFPGAHEWSYWDLHVQDSILFHCRNLGIPVSS